MDPADEELRGDRLRDRLKTLPLRAVVAFGLRCAKRVEVVTRYKRLTTEAYAAGLDSLRRWRTYATTTRAAAHATDVRTLSQLNLGSPGEPGEPSVRLFL